MWSFRCRAEVCCRSGPIELEVPFGGTPAGSDTWTAASVQRQSSSGQSNGGSVADEGLPAGKGNPGAHQD